MATFSIVGGETLMGREIAERIEEDGLAASVQMIGAGDAAGLLTQMEGEPTVLTPLDSERLRASDVIFCAGDASSTRRAQELAGDEPVLVDLTAALEDLPGARLRPAVRVPAPVEARVHVMAHPAASTLAVLLEAAHRVSPLRHAVVQVFEPASERGKAGIHELQQQVSSLLSFRPLEKRVFDAQLGFNMLPRYGEDAPERLEDLEARILRHLATLLEGRIPLPSLRLIQAPVFHGYSLSLWLDFEARPDVPALSAEWTASGVDVRGPQLDPPTNAGIAGQSGIAVGLIEADPNHPRALWLWAVVDNLRLAADGAVEVARAALGSRSR